jgi:molybdopterin converting factor small subunit
MSVRVEFYGIVAHRAGVPQTTVDGLHLGEVLANLAAELPALQMCIRDGHLLPGYLVNINGNRFVSDPGTPIRPGDSLLLLSADAGG